MRLRRLLMVVILGASVLVVSPTRADALDRCAGADPFTPALKNDVASRFGGHHMTARVYDTRTAARLT